MRPDHFFDWHAFKFSVVAVVFCVVVVAAGRFGLLSAGESRSVLQAASPSVVLIQEAHPAPPASLSTTLSTTTSEHVINTLTIADAVPSTGKFIAADFSTMILTLYRDGVPVAKYPILATGASGSAYETPPGFYTVETKEQDHFNLADQTHLPWSVQFYGNYFIHGAPYYDNGSPVNGEYTSGCIELSTGDAKAVYAFADAGIGIFVYDPLPAAPSSLVLDAVPVPALSATSYVVADIDTGDVFLEQGAEEVRPVASVTKLMTAFVADETIAFDTSVALSRTELLPARMSMSAPKTGETFFVGDLLYPLLMQSNTALADSLASSYGTAPFIAWMNAVAGALDMPSTHFADASGASPQNVSTPDDLFRLASYLAHTKSFILDITRTPAATLTARDGSTYAIDNTAAPKGAAVSVLSVPVNGVERRAAVIVLGSSDPAVDTMKLADWFNQSVQQGAAFANTTCISCPPPPPYRKIQL